MSDDITLEETEKKKIWEDKKSILSSMLAEKPEEVMEIVNGAASLALMDGSTKSASTESSLTESALTESASKLSPVLIHPRSHLVRRKSCFCSQPTHSSSSLLIVVLPLFVFVLSLDNLTPC